MLDLKCLQSMKRSEETLMGRDIIGRVLLPVVTLEFDYVKKDMRQRKYAMEDDSMAQVGGDSGCLSHKFSGAENLL